MGSDAYASGEALVALRESGAVPVTDRAYRKGLEFLLRTQIEDGSWIVETRAVPDPGVLRERVSLRREPVGVRGRDRMGDHRARARDPDRDGDSASARAGAGTAQARRRERRARRLRADSDVAGTDARAAPVEDGRLRRRDRRRRTVRCVLLRLSPRRPHDRGRASRPHQDRGEGRQAVGTARRNARRSLGTRPGTVRGAPGPRVRHRTAASF